MKAALLFGKRDVRIVELERPKIADNEILVRLLACGICGTDLEKYEGDFITPPVLGHEVVGVIEEIGQKVEGLEKGSRVFVHHHVPCRVCYYCLRGDFTLCDQFSKVNLDPCGLSEYFRVPSQIIERKGVFKLSNNIDTERATFIEPLACCIRAVNKISPQIGDKIAIYGSGPAGLLLLMLLTRIYGTDVAAIDINDLRLDKAEKIGAALTINPTRRDISNTIKAWSNDRGVDIAIVATSSTEATKQAIKTLRKGGKLCLFGSPKKGAEIPLDLSYIFINEIKIIPTYSTTEYEIYQAISLLEKGIIAPEHMITHRFRLEQSVDALEITRRGDAIKTIIKAS
ncbi:MAG TPA: alcohol dehydrogenase catalytic domain-containing protein [Geobacterales bacterium]|nr:alcohol dehydrogenase catalytic domain-containing protein [Geobacterales bacterium]